jgi:hypothetical protein
MRTHTAQHTLGAYLNPDIRIKLQRNLRLVDRLAIAAGIAGFAMMFLSIGLKVPIVMTIAAGLVGIAAFAGVKRLRISEALELGSSSAPADRRSGADRRNKN